MLIPDLANQLFQNVLHGDDTQRAAVAVVDDGDVGFFLLQQLEQVGNLQRFGHEHRRGHDFGKLLAVHDTVVVEVALVDDTHDVVDIFIINQQAGETALVKDLGDCTGIIADADGLQIHTVGENVLGIPVGELDGRAQQLVLILIQAALLLDFVHQHQQLFLGHAAVFGVADDLAHQVFQGREHKGEGGQHHHQYPQEGGGEHGKLFGHFLRQTFGGDLAENQYHHGGNNGGDGSACVSHQMHKQQGTHRGHGDVHDVVADQNGGDHLIVFVGELQGQNGLFVTLLGKHLQTGFVQRRKSGLGSGKIGRKSHHDSHKNNRSCITHKKS